MLTKSKVQSILHQFNTSITFEALKTDSTKTNVKVYHLVDTYYIKYSPFQPMRTRLKDIIELLNNETK